MLKQLVKNLISYTAKEIAKAIVKEQQNSYIYVPYSEKVVHPYSQPEDFNTYEIRWTKSSELDNLVVNPHSTIALN